MYTLNIVHKGRNAMAAQHTASVRKQQGRPASPHQFQYPSFGAGALLMPATAHWVLEGPFPVSQEYPCQIPALGLSSSAKHDQSITMQLSLVSFRTKCGYCQSAGCISMPHCSEAKAAAVSSEAESQIEGLCSGALYASPHSI